MLNLPLASVGEHSNRPPSDVKLQDMFERCISKLEELIEFFEDLEANTAETEISEVQDYATGIRLWGVDVRIDEGSLPALGNGPLQDLVWTALNL